MPVRGGDPFRALPAIAIVLFIGPVLAGLLGTLLPAFGWLPGPGGALGLDAWRVLLAAPELRTAVPLAAGTAIVATVGALVCSVAIVAGFHTRASFAWLRPCLLPLLALPHLATAIGLAFLIAPSGWAARLLGSLLGWSRPPDLALVQDRWGVALTLGLIVKETPFLTLALLAAAAQVDVAAQTRLARSLGYGAASTYLKVIWPQVYAQIRLPLFAVLAYGLSVVDVAVVLGPASPPPLAPLLWRWFNDPDLTLRLPAAAGSLLLLVLLLGLLALWRGVEAAIGRSCRRWLVAGPAAGTERCIRAAGVFAALVTVGAGFLSLAALAVWSVAGRWTFPAPLPAAWSLQAWRHVLPGLADPLADTLLLAAATALIALIVVIGCVEHETLAGPRPTARVLMLAYLPLLVPQTSFLFGFAVLLVALRLDGNAVAVGWAHLVFVLPYVLLMLRQPWLALDPRYARSARALGKGAVTVLRRIKLPLLLRPVLLAFAVGLSVSVAQYLATLFAGGGRVATLTTETLAFSSGGDRRDAAVGGLLMAALPLLALAAAVAIPAAWPRPRRVRRR